MMSWSKYSFQFTCQVFLLKLYYSCQLNEARLAKAIKLIMTIAILSLTSEIKLFLISFID